MTKCQKALHVNRGDECLLTLVRLKFARFPAGIKAKTLSSICNVPKDKSKDKNYFLPCKVPSPGIYFELF